MRWPLIGMMPLRNTLCIGLAAVLLTITSCANAGGASAPPSAQKPSPNASAAAHPSAPKSSAPTSTRPLWSELTPAQQVALKPLSVNWNDLSEGRKRKWLTMSTNYPNMSSTEQAKLHDRMTEWVTLSVQQRNQARLNFAQAKAISPAEKQAKWQAYQALSPEEKHKLATKQPPPPKGAALAVKPDTSAQLTKVPTSSKSAKPGQKIAAATHKIDQKTLLPHSEKAAAASAPLSLPPTATSAVTPSLTSTD